MRFPVLQRPSGIAVVELHGVIGGRIRPAKVLPLLEGVRRSRRLKAVLLDIDSGGGSATASEELCLALTKLADQKPLVAFLRGHGASGAYMMACAAHRIVSMPRAVVGSIGVISFRPIVEELLHRWGVEVAVQKSGRLKDMGAPYRHPTDEERQKLQELVDEFHEAFLDIVAKERKLDKETLRQQATGEVFTGRRARELGLVDELGDLDRALDLASELGRVPRRPVSIRPRRGMRERMLGRFAQSLVQTTVEELEERLFYRIL